MTDRNCNTDAVDLETEFECFTADFRASIEKFCRAGMIASSAMMRAQEDVFPYYPKLREFHRAHNSDHNLNIPKELRGQASRCGARVVAIMYSLRDQAELTQTGQVSQPVRKKPIDNGGNSKQLELGDPFETKIEAAPPSAAPFGAWQEETPLNIPSNGRTISAPKPIPAEVMADPDGWNRRKVAEKVANKPGRKPSRTAIFAAMLKNTPPDTQREIVYPDAKEMLKDQSVLHNICGEDYLKWVDYSSWSEPKPDGTIILHVARYSHKIPRKTHDFSKSKAKQAAAAQAAAKAATEQSKKLSRRGITKLD